MNWRKNCLHCWNTNTNHLVDRFCNGGSFVMAMRLKHGLELDKPTHHWNGPETEGTHDSRVSDVREYQRECALLNKGKSHTPAKPPKMK